MRKPLVNSGDELLDRLGLITGGCKIGFEFEGSLVLFHAERCGEDMRVRRFPMARPPTIP